MSHTANPCHEALAVWAHGADLEGRPLAVALSGGADSTALALAAQDRWARNVVALHVHHGLQAAADGFEAHVRGQCQRWGMACHVQHIQAQHAPGQSPEAAAREGRYRALAELAQSVGASHVLLGHHADDQVETLMLALSRGAGLPGLSAMPTNFERHGVRFARPILSVDPQVLRYWLQGQGVAVVQDPSNENTDFTRNRIRHGLLQAWRRDFPAYASTLARSAEHAAQAQTLLEDLANIDLQRVGVPPSIAGLQALSAARQTNALRHWLRTEHGVAPSQAQMAALLLQIRACTTRGHQIELKVGAGMVQRQRQHLQYTAPL
ncbi:MAG: tRNA lysidine(34) synthetase TilS [Hydrogenophaga sp.]|nr:tRNA lysidine(34) synthetase TilS [Hydrogenophaga sp.]